MIVPRLLGKPAIGGRSRPPGAVRKPAIGGGSSSSRSRDAEEERLYYVRSPVALNFAGFVYLLGKQFTGRSVIYAWEKMPLLKWGKYNRGSSTKRDKGKSYAPNQALAGEY